MQPIIHTLSLRMANVYLIQSEHGLILVDAGMPGDERHIQKAMKSLGYDELRLIFLTHAHLDHCGSAAAMKQISGAPVAIHRADADDLSQGKTRLGHTMGRGRVLGYIFPLIERLISVEPVQADILLEDNEDISDYGLAARIIHTPGHTPGSSSLLLEDRIAFVGDLVSSNNGAHAQRYYATDWSQIPGSLKRLQQIAPKIVYPGHGRLPIDAETFNRITVQDYAKTE